MLSNIAGRWSYRSLINDPDLSLPFNDLAFGAGVLELSTSEDGRLSGILGGSGWALALDGTIENSDPQGLRWQGRGTIGEELWVYDYVGYVVPNWPHGVNQEDVIVGSVIRTKPHSGGQATEGFTASFYAVRM